MDDLVATLRTNHIRRVRDGQCTVYAGLTFLDILVNVERIADQCSNIGVFTLSMTCLLYTSKRLLDAAQVRPVPHFFVMATASQFIRRILS